MSSCLPICPSQSARPSVYEQERIFCTHFGQRVDSRDDRRRRKRLPFGRLHKGLPLLRLKRCSMQQNRKGEMASGMCAHELVVFCARVCVCVSAQLCDFTSSVGECIVGCTHTHTAMKHHTAGRARASTQSPSCTRTKKRKRPRGELHARLAQRFQRLDHGVHVRPVLCNVCGRCKGCAHTWRPKEGAGRRDRKEEGREREEGGRKREG